MDLLEIMQNRRSVRKYAGEEISQEKLTKVLQAGLLSASSRGRKPWEFILVQEKDTLKKMSDCRDGAAKMLEGAEAAIVVLGSEDKTDVWIEDCAIVMSNMHLMADSLDLGSCWIQGRLRETADGTSTEEYLRKLLDFPENSRLEAILSLGMPQNKGKRTELEDLDMNKVHREKY